MKEKEDIKKLYQRDDVTSTFDEEREEFLYQRYKHKIETNILRRVLNSLKKGRKVKVLDVACGTGRMLPIVLEYDIDYVGLDTSKSMTKYLKQKAAKRGKEIKLVLGDATRMPFKDKSFDFVFSYHLTWHLPKELEIKMIKEMQRVTKNGGYFVFDILNEGFIWEKMKSIFRNNVEGGIFKMRIDEVRSTINSSNYSLEKLSDAKIKNSFLYSLFNILNILRRVLPVSFYHMIYFVVEKNENSN